MGEVTGTVFNIQGYSIHDGPGIRTVVFLKGCYLSCLWCSNPESQRFRPEIEFFPERCIRCGQCIRVCPENVVNQNLESEADCKIDRDRCTGCGQCTRRCPTRALVLAGRTMSTTEVMEALCKDSAYYRKSGGGVTLSGGEPLAQIDFATAILKRCFALNMHTAVETAGYLPWECFQTISPYTDLFLFDIKHMDEKAHKRGTGVSNRSILENLEKLSGIVGEIIVRIPLIPGFNTNKENLHKTAEFISGIGIACVELLPFHHFGREKYRRFGREYPLGDRPSLYGEKGEVVLLAEDIFRRYGVDILD